MLNPSLHGQPLVAHPTPGMLLLNLNVYFVAARYAVPKAIPDRFL